MTKLEQAARQALEALENSDDGGGLRYTEYKAVLALQEALAEPHKESCACEVCRGCDNADIKAEQAEQEPVATMEVFSGWWGKEANFEQLNYDLPDGFYKLYAAPVRTKDLTDDEIYIAVGSAGFGASLIAGCRAAIAADREKNRG